MHWDDTIDKREASTLLKCESAKDGDCTKQTILLNNISENTFHTGVHLQLSNYCKRWRKESYLATCSAVLNYLKFWDQNLINSFQVSRIPYLARMILRPEEKPSRRRKIIVSTSENVDIQLHITKWDTYYSSIVFSSTIGSFSHKNTPFCSVHSKEILHWLCRVRSGRRKARWRKSNFKCCRRNNEASSQQPQHLTDLGSEPTYCNQELQEQKNTCGF